MHVPVPGFKPVQVDLPKITIIGATTNDGLVAAPMRDRFGLAVQLDYYTVDELAEIAQRDLTIFGVSATPSATKQIAMRSRGTPRLAKRFVRRVIDYATVRANGEVTEAVLDECFEQLGIDDLGLDRVDHQILQTINGNGGTASIQTLSFSTGVDVETLRDKHESYLIRSGIVQVGSKGRFLTSYGEEIATIHQPR
jgi:Holliday junction DNA helicase RuvB